MKVLIVDDDNIVRRVLKRAVLGLEHEAVGCVDAEQALEAMDRDNFPLVILDWMLPGMDGLELCRRIRKRPGGQNCFVLMVTAKNTHEDLMEVLDAGADDYIAKPIDVKLLKTRITVAERMIKKLDTLRK